MHRNRTFNCNKLTIKNQNCKLEIKTQPLPRLQKESPSAQATECESPRSLSLHKRAGSTENQLSMIEFESCHLSWAKLQKVDISCVQLQKATQYVHESKSIHWEIPCHRRWLVDWPGEGAADNLGRGSASPKWIKFNYNSILKSEFEIIGWRKSWARVGITST